MTKAPPYYYENGNRNAEVQSSDACFTSNLADCTLTEVSPGCFDMAANNTRAMSSNTQAQSSDSYYTSDLADYTTPPGFLGMAANNAQEFSSNTQGRSSDAYYTSDLAGYTSAEILPG